MLTRLAAVILFAATLEAASIESNTVTFDMTGSNLLSSFTPFDTSLGTLTQVEAIGNADLIATWAVTGFGSGSINVTAGFEYWTPLQVAGVSVDPIFFANGEFVFGCTNTGTEVTTCSNSGPMSDIQSRDTLVSGVVPLSTFTGPSNIPFALFYNTLIAGPTLGDGATDGDAFWQAGPEIAGSIHLLYTYDAAVSTPEPSIVWLSGIGLAMLAIARRMR